VLEGVDFKVKKIVFLLCLAQPIRVKQQLYSGWLGFNSKKGYEEIWFYWNCCSRKWQFRRFGLINIYHWISWKTEIKI